MLRLGAARPATWSRAWPEGDSYMPHSHPAHEAGADHRAHCVSLVPIFAQLTPEERAEIAGFASQRQYSRREQLYGAGDDPRGLMIVHRGRVKVYRIAESGHEQLIRVLRPGEFIGEASLFSKEPTDHFALALEDAEICSLRSDDIRGVLMRHPSVAYKMLEAMSGRLERTERLAGSLTGEDAEQRIASYLVELSQVDGTQTVRLPMSKKDLASYLGTTPETLSRRLAMFEDRGWISQGPRGRIEIRDLDELIDL